MPRLRLLRLLANGTRSPGATTLPPEPAYDHRGALWYVVTVVTVYAMAILFMIVSHINRRTGKREMDREVSAFLRSAPSVRIEEERQRRRNLKRAMQPFIRMALDRRSVGIQVSVAQSGELLTQPSIEALFVGLPVASTEYLAVTDRVLERRRRSRHAEASNASLESGWHSADSPEEAAAAAAAAATGDVVAFVGSGGANEKAVQCCLDARETLARRNRRLLLLRPVPSQTELGALMQLRQLNQQQQQPQPQLQRQHLQLDDADRLLHRGAANILATRTHVPRFLAITSGAAAAVSSTLSKGAATLQFDV